MRKEVIGVDTYNQCTMGETAKTLSSIATDSDHLPCVVIGIVKNETTPKVTEEEVMFTLSSSDSHRGWYGGLYKQGEA